MARPIRRIVVPVDLSEESLGVLDIATSLAKSHGAEILFVFVAFPELPDSAGLAIAEVDRAIRIEQKKFEQIRPTDPTVEHRHVLLRGTPEEEILGFSEKVEADLIVLSTHGRGGLSRMLMGSVAEKIVRKAPCPVMTLRATDARSQAA